MTVLPFVRPARPRRYLLCPPDHFEVTYAINPWMQPGVEVDRQRAMRQWQGLRDTYLDLGHEVATDLDTALAVLDDTMIAYLPAAFDASSRTVLEVRFPDAIIATAADAEVLGLNAVSDGRHVVLPVEAEHLAAALADRGFVPVAVELDELRKAGGGPKCCTLELRPPAPVTLQEVSA